WSRSTARCESVFGSEKLFAFRLPTACETARTPTARTIQARTTIRRCAIVQRVSFSIESSNPGRESSRFAKLARRAENRRRVHVTQIFTTCRIYAYTERR